MTVILKASACWRRTSTEVPTMTTDLRRPRRALKILLALWLLALPAFVAVTYLLAAISPLERDRFYGTSGALFIGGVLALPWLIGAGLLAWFAFRSRSP